MANVENWRARLVGAQGAPFHTHPLSICFFANSIGPIHPYELTGGQEDCVAVVGDWHARLVGVPSGHNMVVTVQVRGRLVVVDRCEQLRAHASTSSAHAGDRSARKKPQKSPDSLRGLQDCIRMTCSLEAPSPNHAAVQ